MSATDVDTPSTKTHTSSIRELYGGDHMNVASVGERTAGSRPSLAIRGHTQDRDPTSVMNVGKPSTRSSPLLNTSELTLGRSRMNVLNVGNPPAISQASEYIGEFIWERNPRNVTSVGKPTIGCGLSLNIRKYTQGETL